MNKYKEFDRVQILGFLIVAIFAVFLVRLFYLQIIQHDFYVARARSEQVKRLVIPAKRGLIYLMDGRKPTSLVFNQEVYRVIADPKIVKDADIDRITRTIRRIAGGTAVDDLRTLLEDKKSRYAVLATRLSHSQADMIKKADITGIGLQAVSQRVYPEKELAAQVLGFVNSDGEGKYGAEGALNTELRGKDGVLQSVTDISNVPLTLGRDNIRTAPVDGKNVVLSIDRNIQAYARDALQKNMNEVGAKYGSVLVMNPNTGKIMASLSLPDYDPSYYYKVKDLKTFVNEPTMVPYEPASVIKSFTLAAGIEKGVVTPQSTFYNKDYIKVEDRTIFNATRGLTGQRTMQEVMDYSLNTGTVTIAERLGNGTYITKQARQTMYDYFYNKFGLGQRTGVEISGEAPGTLYSPDSEQGNAVRYSNMTFGQGLNATMVQVAAGYCSLVNGGSYYKPSVIEGYINSSTGVVTKHEPKVLRRAVQARTAEQMREVIYNVRQKSFSSTQDLPGYYIGGKTGTAQALNSDGTYSHTETIGSYIGFGGTKKRTEYVIMVKLSGPGKNIGGAHAMPAFLDISNWLLQYLRVQPEV